jgi:hypothetical protein
MKHIILTGIFTFQIDLYHHLISSVMFVKDKDWYAKLAVTVPTALFQDQTILSFVLLREIPLLFNNKGSCSIL